MLARHGSEDEICVSQILQLHAAIACPGPAVPAHLDRMGGDAGDRTRSGGVSGLPADLHDAIAQRQSTRHCRIHDDFPD